jgi:hypothetical protein
MAARAVLGARCPARHFTPTSIQLPPQITRAEEVGWYRASHHCHTLPCKSYRPNLFGAYEPTLVGRPRDGPLSAFPAGSLPLKFACFDDRSLVGLSK